MRLARESKERCDDDEQRDSDGAAAVTSRAPALRIVPRASEDTGSAAPEEVAPRPFDWRRGFLRVTTGFSVVASLVIVWWVIAVVGNYPSFILPRPWQVAERLWSMLLDGSLARNFGVTCLEAGTGFLAALVVGTVLGYLVARSHWLERVVSPYIAVSQGLPVVALAPLLVLWVQDDLWRAVVIVGLIVFFPILINTIVGLRGVDRSLLEVARIEGASFWQTVRYVELPLSLRALFGGLKMGVTLSITGAVVAELVSSQAGLGFLLILGRGLFDTTMIFVGLVALAFLALVAYSLVTLAEKLVISWE